MDGCCGVYNAYTRWTRTMTQSTIHTDRSGCEETGFQKLAPENGVQKTDCFVVANVCVEIL